MSTPVRSRVGALATAAVIGVLPLSGCVGGAEAMVASGRVDNRLTTVAVPVLGGPVGRVAAVPISQGDRVAAGQPLISLDAAALDAAVASARADQAVAEAQPKVLTQALSDAVDTRSDLRKKRSDLDDAIDKLKTNRKTVTRALTTLASKRKQVDAAIRQVTAKRTGVVAGIKQLTQASTLSASAIRKLTQQRDTATEVVAQLEASGAGADDPQLAAAKSMLASISAKLAGAQGKQAQLNAALAQARAGLKKLDAGLREARAGRTKLIAAQKQASAGLAKLDAGLKKARIGRAKLDDALDKVADAIRELTNARTLARLNASASGLAVDRAETARAQADVSAPEGGVVVSVARLGDVLAPGATLVTLRPESAVDVTTWLSPEQAARTCAGASAVVTTDWGISYAARLTRFGVATEYPPSSLATSEVHLTRAVGVTVTLDDTPNPPPAGVGVGVRIEPCDTRP